MKITDLVSTVKARFPVLLTGDPQVQAYLVKALQAYQEKAGVLRTVEIAAPIDTGLYPLPDDTLAVAMCKDAIGNYVPNQTQDDVDSGNLVLKLVGSGCYEFPLTVNYLVDLTVYALTPDRHIPTRIASMIANYLECLIGEDNDDRIARIEAVGKMDVSRIPSRVDRSAQLQAIEEQMSSARAIIPAASIIPI